MSKLQSIYIDRNKAAIFSFDLEEGGVSLMEVWRSSAFDRNIAAAALARQAENTTYLVNPDPQSETSFMKSKLKRRGLSDVRIAEQFYSIAGETTLAELADSSQLKTDAFEGWKQIQAAIRQNEGKQAVDVMALFQGLLWAEKRINQPTVPVWGRPDRTEMSRKQNLGRLYGIL